MKKLKAKVYAHLDEIKASSTEQSCIFDEFFDVGSDIIALDLIEIFEDLESATEKQVTSLVDEWLNEKS